MLPQTLTPDSESDQEAAAPEARRSTSQKGWVIWGLSIPVRVTAPEPWWEVLFLMEADVVLCNGWTEVYVSAQKALSSRIPSNIWLP